MCHIWQNPTLPIDEISLETLDKIPSGIDFLNLTGGEPTLRNDLVEIVDILYPKAAKLEINSNGLHPERIEPLIKKYPNIKVRFSLEGMEETNNRIRGEEDGYQRKINGLLRFKELGGKDLGFALTIQDDNFKEIVPIFELARKNNFELSTSTLHNGFQFHKSDNVPYDRLRIAKSIENLIIAMLKTYDVKLWFRAYMNLGLISKVLGHRRLLRCTAGTSFAFVDPWSDVYACNVRPDLKIGNLEDQSWEEIFGGRLISAVREKVYHCQQNCWMVGSAKTAMRQVKYAKLPKWEPTAWVIKNKLRLMLNKCIPFNQYIDYSSVHQDRIVPKRAYFLERKKYIRHLQAKNECQYKQFGNFFNR
jgi:MoaA/NifB/PqqE/SkfB family radical SAM enzyme